jgi:hypothetical protein
MAMTWETLKSEEKTAVGDALAHLVALILRGQLGMAALA